MRNKEPGSGNNRKNSAADNDRGITAGHGAKGGAADKKTERSMKLRRAAAVFFFVLTAALASIRGGKIVYALLYLSVILPAASVLYTVYVYARLKIVQKINDRIVVKNEPVTYTCRLSNETQSVFTRIKLVPFDDLSLMTDYDSSRVFSLQPGNTEELHSSVICLRRGVYPVGIKTVVIRDILGIAELAFKPPVEYDVTVYPRLLHLDRLDIFTFEGSRVRLGKDRSENIPSDILRDYIPGDDPRKIHWKASAHSGSLLVRQENGIERPSLLVVLDIDNYGEKSAIEREDNMLETLLALCDYCVSRGIGADVYWQGGSISLYSYSDLSLLYDWTCGMSFLSGQPPVEIPDRPFTCCALLTAGRGIPAAGTLAEAAEAGAECVLIEFGADPAEASPSWDPRLRLLRVPDRCSPEELLSGKSL